MAEEADVQSNKPEAVVAGIRQVASAALSAPAATPAQAALAIAVLEATAEPPADREPREAASIAAMFNLHMDAVLDAANASRNKRDRVTRRAMMARAIDQAGLVLMDRGMVAGFFQRLTEQQQQLGNYDRTMQMIASRALPADVESAAAFLDDLLEHHSPEAALQWNLVRKWMTPDAGLSDDNSDASRINGGSTHVE